MPINMRLLQILFALCVLVGILLLMIRRKSNESVSLIWILIAVGAAVQGAFPQILFTVAEWFDVKTPALLALSFIVICLILLTFYLSSEVAVSQTKIRELAIHISILNKEVQQLKNPGGDEEEKEII